MNTLEVDSVSLSFGHRKLLSNIYLKCTTGDIIALIGRNGCGKSTLMKIIFGTERGENQSVRLNRKYTRQLFKIPNTVSYLPQDGFAMQYLTFFDLVKIYGLEASLSHLLQIEEIGNNAKIKFANLSGGNKRLMEIMTVLYSKASFVMLDEPFSHLSPLLVEKIIPHIRRQSQTKGIILTDHQHDSVASVCDRYHVLSHGTLSGPKKIQTAGASEDSTNQP